jgi:hypothetical protein
MLARGLTLRTQSSAIPDWIRRRANKPHILPASIPNPHLLLCPRPSAPPHMQALTLHVAYPPVVHKSEYEKKESFR